VSHRTTLTLALFTVEVLTVYVVVIVVVIAVDIVDIVDVIVVTRNYVIGGWDGQGM
jgi:hypothetical protein